MFEPVTAATLQMDRATHSKGTRAVVSEALEMEVPILIHVKKQLGW